MSNIDRFVIESNIKNFKALLKTELEPSTRDTVCKLLADAEQELNNSGLAPKKASWHPFWTGLVYTAATVAQAA